MARTPQWMVAATLALAALAGCQNNADSSAAARPAADARGIISYPGYQVAVARRGDTVDSLAARIGLPAGDLAAYQLTLNPLEII